MITLTHDVGVPQQVQEAVREANALLSGTVLYERISARPTPFDLTEPKDLQPSEISDAIRNMTETFNVVMYKFDHSNTTGGYRCVRSTRREIRLSDRPNHVDNALDVIVSTLIHECVHAVDCFTSTIEVGHGGNRRSGKGNTAPYWIGDQAGVIIRENNKDEGLSPAEPYTYDVEVYYENESRQ